MKGDNKIEEIKNPKEPVITVKAKSVLISRIHKEHESEEFKMASFRFFDENNPHKLQIFPKKFITYTNTEKIRIMGLNVSYYLEGNDIVVNDLEELTITHENHALYLKGKQQHIERRNK
jgi:hypothetical protein